MSGRKKSSCRDYVLAGKPDSDGVIKYECSKCHFTRRTKIFGATHWADHLVLDCTKIDQETKGILAEVRTS